MAKSVVKPMNATKDEICRMKYDHCDFGRWSLMTDGNKVWLSEQRLGQNERQGFQIPRRVFNRLLAWYTSEQKLALAAGEP